jgi:hypothetical protein
MNANVNANVNSAYVCLYSAAGFSLLLQDLPAGADDHDRLLEIVQRDSEVGDSFPGVAVRNDMVRCYITDLDRSWQLVLPDGGIDLDALSSQVSVALLKGELYGMDLDARNMKTFMAFLLTMAS